MKKYIFKLKKSTQDVEFYYKIRIILIEQLKNLLAKRLKYTTHIVLILSRLYCNNLQNPKG